MRHGSQIDPPNRFESTHLERSLDQVWEDEEFLDSIANRKIEYLEDRSESIVSKNQSPDLPFNYSLNPYRGCVHGCSYCYARPGHEYLGMNAGLDFETRIVVKRNAAGLFRKFLSRTAWQPEPINFSGVTDCYQPIERELKLTRDCLEVALECGQPIGIVTKNALILRDLDLLKALADNRLVHVYFSVTTLDPQLARDLEPRASIPSARLRAIRELANVHVPVGAMVAPVIPGLNDSEIPRVLQAIQEAGAQVAQYILLRLPLSVEPVFREWLERTRPLKAEMILGRIAQTRDGKLNQSEWGKRMVGSGLIADQIRSLFHAFKNRLELNGSLPAYRLDLFRRPTKDPRQMRLF